MAGLICFLSYKKVFVCFAKKTILNTVLSLRRRIENLFESARMFSDKTFWPWSYISFESCHDLLTNQMWVNPTINSISEVGLGGTCTRVGGERGRTSKNTLAHFICFLPDIYGVSSGSIEKGIPPCRLQIHKPTLVHVVLSRDK